MTEPMSFVMRMCSEFRTGGQSLKEFVDEFSKLTDEEKEEYWKTFNESGLPTRHPADKKRASP